MEKHYEARITRMDDVRHALNEREQELLLAFASGMQAAADLRRAEEPQRRGE